MINAIRRLFGLHVHEWLKYSEPIEDWCYDYGEDYGHIQIAPSYYPVWQQTRYCKTCGMFEKRRSGAP